MTSKGLARIRRAVALRKYAVNMKPYNGGETKIVKIEARSRDIAAADAMQQNPGFIAVSTRTIRVIE